MGRWGKGDDKKYCSKCLFVKCLPSMLSGKKIIISGARTRQRATVQEPKGNGRVCPTSFNQTRPCFEHGCYTWVVSPWSQCMGAQGVCGYGIQTRNITCVADGGLPVNSSNCAPDPNVVVTKVSVSCPTACNTSHLTNYSRETPKRVIGKQCRPRSDAAECGI